MMTESVPAIPLLDAAPRSCRPSHGKRRVCIMAPDISGPIRNGGVGTAYGHLAELVAGCGHEVTILFTLGKPCSDPLQVDDFHSRRDPIVVVSRDDLTTHLRQSPGT